MDSLDFVNVTKSTDRLVQDSDYYKYIFKKTEKIVSVVFYITHNVSDNTNNVRYVEDLEATAQMTHNKILESLEVRAHVADEAVRSSAHALISLDSKLRVAHATGLITAEALQVLINEIDAVLRGMNKYLDGKVMGDVSAASALPAGGTTTSKRTAPTAAASSPSDMPAVPPKPHRRDRILTVLEARGEASIKDISEIVTDVSEKTIQRELNAMIKDNLVKRHGERRWSKYSLF